MFTFKHDEDRLSYDSLDWRLRRLFIPMVDQWFKSHGHDTFTITSITSGAHTSATHREYRAVDIRLAPLTLQDLEAFAIWVNSCFSFLPGYEVAIVGRVDPKGGHNDHLHIQVPRPYRKDGRISLVVT